MNSEQVNWSILMPRNHRLYGIAFSVHLYFLHTYTNYIKVFLSNNLYTVIWFQVTILNRNNLWLYAIKYFYLMLIIFKTWSHLCQIDLPLRVDLGIMAMKRYSTEFEPQYQMQFSIIFRTSWVSGGILCWGYNQLIPSPTNIALRTRFR